MSYVDDGTIGFGGLQSVGGACHFSELESFTCALGIGVIIVKIIIKIITY